MQAERVRLMAALFAAAGLHALALFWPAPPTTHTIHNGVLRVDLTERAASPTTSRISTVEAVRSTHRKPTSSPAPPFFRASRTPMRMVHPHAKPAAIAVPASPRRPSARLKPSHALQRNHVALAAGAHARSSRRLMHGSERISPQVRSMLLASITYPRVARRRGWQGKGEFQLLITRENIRKVRVLASTGYHQLDQAATRGLLTAGRIPLDDGIYKLPVEFRLQ